MYDPHTSMIAEAPYEWLDVTALAAQTGGTLTAALFEPGSIQRLRFHAEVDYPNGYTFSITWEWEYGWNVAIKYQGQLEPIGAFPTIISPCDQIRRVAAGEIEAIARQAAALP